jgi:uncharacterized protein (DUF1778 family)
MAIARVKTQNLSCRVSPEHKALIEKAARESGYTLSDFIVHTMVAGASEILREPSAIQLTSEEWKRFTTSLDQPGREPSQATKEAVELFKSGHDEGDRYTW